MCLAHLNITTTGNNTVYGSIGIIWKNEIGAFDIIW